MDPVTTRRARAALEALCRRIAPSAYDADPPIDVAGAVERRLAGMEAPLVRDVIGALHFFDHPITGMLLSGRPRRFSTLPAAEQDALLSEWERSPLALRRTVFQGLRRLILATYYALPEAHPRIGYIGPLHGRAPAFPWEGPVPGEPTGDEPVARAGTGASAHTGGEEAGAGPARAEWRPAAEGTQGGLASGVSLATDTHLRADVCIIGSGAGGAVAAARLAEAGRHVVILEEGSFYTGDDFDDDESRLAPLLYADSAARATDDLSCILLQGRCVGGGTTVNWMMTLRPQPWVLDEWEHEHGLELLSARVLEPELDRIETEIHARTIPADAHSPSNRVILEGCERLGWRTLEARINADGCVRAGSCGLGCRSGAKRSAGDVYLPRALAAGATLYSDVRADRIELLERATPGTQPLKRVHATACEASTREPHARVTVDAPVVVLAAGAVGTPALLERSGLGGGGVGRWLRLHPTTGVFGLYDRTMYGGAGIPQTAVCSEFLQGADGYGFWIECPPLRPGLAAAALPGFGAEHRRRMELFPHIAALIVLIRDGADRRRSSGDVRVDRRGRIRVRYRMSTQDRAQLVAGVQAAARLHLVGGADHALTLHVGSQPVRTDADIQRLALRHYGPNYISLFTAHVNGTCRMGTDARESGCTPEGERHGVPGLFVADGSLFPTAPGVNPQAAIIGLASLVAGRIADRPA
jgi:choline dehydrogenase-like flavoprotein